MRAELAQLHRSLGVTFVYVTHDQAEALTMSDRMAVMMGGEILQLGAPDEIYRNPLDRRVAEFIGSPKINMISGEVDGDGRVSAHGVLLRRKVKGSRREIRIGLRPEHLQLAGRQGENDAWSFKLTHLENMGSDVYLHGYLNGAEVPVVARALPEQTASISIGDELFMRPRPEAAMAFGHDDRRLALAEV